MWHAWERKVWKALVGKARERTSLGRPRSRCDGIKWMLGIGWGV
jgi:hypothetical protein